MIYLAVVYFLFLGWRFWAICLNVCSRLYLPIAKTKNSQLVSVLIPARNEAHNLSNLIPALQNQTYKNIEILIYDDSSTDSTWEVIQHFTNQWSNLKGIKGDALPTGWLGKNHACFQLAKKAQGEYLLFLDADVNPMPQMVENALDYILMYSLKLLSIFPKQEIKNFGEKITVPIMQQVLLTLLPMRFIHTTHKPSFAAANGQFMLFESNTYRRLEPHSWVKNHPVEDIQIIRLYKKFHLPVATLLGKGTVTCRMYNNYSGSVAGFSKNLLHFFGNSRLFLFFYNIVTLMGWIILFWLPMPLLVIGVCMLLTLHFGWIRLSGFSFSQIFLIPIQTFTLLHLSFVAIKSKHQKTIQWKNRKITGI